MSMAESKKTKGGPDEIDVHVGSRLRIRRTLLGVSQEKLAGAIGLTFQQIQKYERGLNRISAGRLFQFSRILDIPVTYFYENMGADALGASDNDQDGFSYDVGLARDVLESRETLELLRAYYSFEDENTRKDIVKFIKSMGKSK